jgi:hypothetical protein
MFPAEVAGWKKRQPYDDDLMDMREVPLSRGFNTGIPGAPMSAVPFLVPKRRSRHPSAQYDEWSLKWRTAK